VKVYISVDIEGVAGVVDPDEVIEGSARYHISTRLMTGEANAAIDGALEAGATEVVVNDSHGTQRNLLIEDLNPAARVIFGSPKLLGMVEGVEAGFDAACFVGYHARIGTTPAIMDHTYLTIAVSAIRLNGELQSEGTLNAGACGYFGCPVVLFTGDQSAVAQMHERRPEIEGVVVKEARGRHAASSLHPSVARERIKAGARRALERRAEIPSIRYEGRQEVEIEFHLSSMADYCMGIPGVRRSGARSVAWAGDDFLELFKLTRVLTGLGAQGAVRRR
jgi:D-amino peptidase